MSEKFNITTTFVKDLINNMLSGKKYGGVKFYRDQKLIGFGIKQQATKISYIAEIKVRGKNYRRVIGNAQVISNSQARELAKKFLGDMAAGINVVEQEKENKLKAVTLEKAFKDYLLFKKRAKRTVEEYKRIMDVYLNDWKQKPLTSITYDMVEKLYQEKKETPYMANRIISLLSGIYNYAMIKYKQGNKRIITNNPCLVIKTIEEYIEVSSEKIIEMDEIANLWGATESCRYDTHKEAQTKLLCRLDILLGCRKQELCSLKRKDIDFKHNTFKIQQTKNHRTHTIAYGKYTGEIINKLCEGLSDDDYLFPAPTKSGHLECGSSDLKKIRNAAGIHFCLKDLRHSFTSYAAMFLKIDHCLVNVMTNHKNRDVTYDVYVTVGTSAFDIYRESFQMVEDFILKNAKQ